MVTINAEYSELQVRSSRYRGRMGFIFNLIKVCERGNSYLFPKGILSVEYLICSLKARKCNVRSLCGHVGRVSEQTNLHESSFDVKEVGKWSNTSIHKELLKAFEAVKYTRLLNAIAREGGPHPQLNIKLANIIEKAKRFDPDFPVEPCILASVHPKLVRGISEASAAGGVHIIVDYETSNPSYFWSLVQAICQKYGLNFIGSTSNQLLLFYEVKGILTSVGTKTGRVINCEEAQDLVEKLGVGASLVIAKDGISSVEFHCHPSDLHKMKAVLEQELILEEIFVGYVPKHSATLPDAMKQKVANVILEFCNLPGIQRVYENVK